MTIEEETLNELKLINSKLDALLPADYLKQIDETAALNRKQKEEAIKTEITLQEK